jgi:hypothetical protein
MNNASAVPIILIIFNRPETTRIVFERIRAIKPRTLIVIADGPRHERPGETEICKMVRSIVEKIDWSCELLKNYSATNIGCGIRVAGGIDWAFQMVDQAIILEDDCLPDLSFFRFCSELLERYRDDDRVTQISGSNFLFGRRLISDSYYFSRYPIPCWGWATWRRAWGHFDMKMKNWTEDREECLKRFKDDREKAFWSKSWDEVCSGKVDNWDPQWAFNCLQNNALSIVPAVNLVQNVGFGRAATHTRSRSAALRPAVQQIGYPLRHPLRVGQHSRADQYTAGILFHKRSPTRRVAAVIRRRWLAVVSRLRARAV